MHSDEAAFPILPGMQLRLAQLSFICKFNIGEIANACQAGLCATAAGETRSHVRGEEEACLLVLV